MERRGDGGSDAGDGDAESVHRFRRAQPGAGGAVGDLAEPAQPDFNGFHRILRQDHAAGLHRGHCVRTCHHRPRRRSTTSTASATSIFSAKLFGLAQTSFDHNYAQNLQLQQIYGGGLGWTMFNTPRDEADLKATIQYEKQAFISAVPGSNLNLIGSTFSADYTWHAKLLSYTQDIAFIPAYNVPARLLGDRDGHGGVSRLQELCVFSGHHGLLPERSAGIGSAHQAQFVPVHHGPDLRHQVEVLNCTLPSGTRRTRRRESVANE